MENKKQFVEELSALLSKYCWINGIRKLTYACPGKTYKEEVIVSYFGGHEEVVNVHMDNCLAILKDVCKRGLRH